MPCKKTTKRMCVKCNDNEATADYEQCYDCHLKAKKEKSMI